MKVLIIIPAYNEEENIAAVIGEVRSLCREHPDWDVLAVNDCSGDSTLSVLRSLGTAYLDLPVNLGIGGCVQAGYRYAEENGYDAAVQFDGDGQHEARFLPALLRPIEEGRAELVIGSRYLSEEGFQSTALRRAGGHFLSGMIRSLCGVRITDATSGMRAVSRSLIELFAEQYAQDYPEPESVLLAGLSGARVTEIGVEMRSRAHGKSSIGALGSVYYMIKVSLALLLLRVRRGHKGENHAE